MKCGFTILICLFRSMRLRPFRPLEPLALHHAPAIPGGAIPVDLPIETKGLKVSNFCLDCRVLLKDHAENGFVLADLYVEDAIDIYPATVGADYTIRDYRITVSETKVRSEMELIVLGIAEGLTFVD